MHDPVTATYSYGEGRTYFLDSEFRFLIFLEERGMRLGHVT